MDPQQSAYYVESGMEAAPAQARRRGLSPMGTALVGIIFCIFCICLIAIVLGLIPVYIGASATTTTTTATTPVADSASGSTGVSVVFSAGQSTGLGLTGRSLFSNGRIINCGAVSGTQLATLETDFAANMLQSAIRVGVASASNVVVTPSCITSASSVSVEWDVSMTVTSATLYFSEAAINTAIVYAAGLLATQSEALLGGSYTSYNQTLTLTGTSTDNSGTVYNYVSCVYIITTPTGSGTCTTTSSSTTAAGRAAFNKFYWN